MTTTRFPRNPTAGELADQLVDFVSEQIEALAAHHAPGLVLPRVFAGHAVGPDTRSDLAFTLGLLAEAGVARLAGVSLEAVALATLRGLDGARTDTFYSYRAAETLARFGGYHDNERLSDWSPDELANLRLAFDSTASAAPLRDGKLPLNFAIVVGRCEFARQRLGLLDDPSLLDALCERARELLSRARSGWIDDSNEQRGQFDIYTPDMFLFAEPLAERLGSLWQEGLRAVLCDVDDLALPGGAIVWGRSIGALGIAMTIELAAVGTARQLTESPEVWLARAGWSLAELRDWFGNGVIRAHQHRATMFYRGPARRLQMTLDVLGKLVQAALELRQATPVRAADPFEAWRLADRLVSFGPSGAGREAGAWAFRSKPLRFVLPLVDGWYSEYLPSPRSPGLLESPLGGPLSGVPVIHRRGKVLVAATVPDAIEHDPGGLAVEHDGFREIHANPAEPPRLAGRRRAHYRVEGRSLVGEEHLTLECDPSEIDAVAFQLPMRADRTFDVAFDCQTPHRIDTIDVDGLVEYRSFWSTHTTVHQLDLEPARELAFRYRVTPRLRVGSTAYRHPYDAELYRHLEDRVVESSALAADIHDPLRLDEIDILHLHWPEWWWGVDLDRNARAIARLREAGVRILWTMHNLEPHRSRGDEANACYALWAQAADAVIHHTKWGRDQALARYAYGEQTLHRVLPHGHWGERAAIHALVPRERVEAQLGLAPCAIRLGVVGAPRAEKNVQLVLDAFHACNRDDLQLLVVSIDGERVPDDPRILALPARLEEEAVYYQRLNALDALVYPFAPGMLMTGTALDAVGCHKAAITSDWPVLAEVFGEAAIPYGRSEDDLRRCFESLTPDIVARSADAMRDLAPSLAWSEIAARTFSLLEEISLRPGSSHAPRASL